MICVNCGSSRQSKVTDSRERKKFTMRKRQCMVCGFEYITHEIFISGEMPTDGAKILMLRNLKDWHEALWLEYVYNGRCTLKATSVREVFETSVSFDCNCVLSKEFYGKQWRVWSSRPTEAQRKKVDWK